MKRELLVLRHAKSDWNAGHSSDHERPLAKRGRDAAALIGRFLERSKRRPDLILSSSAVRARTTALLVKQAADWSCDLEIKPDLYGASVDGWLSQVATAPADTERLLVVGHEPTCSGVIGYLSGASVRFPTAAVACLRLWSDDWSGLRSSGDGSASRRADSSAELLWLVKPKLLGFLSSAGFDGLPSATSDGPTSATSDGPTSTTSDGE